MDLGRPSTFNQQKRDIIRLLARKGFIDKEIAQVIGIRERTLQNWKIKHPEFFQSLKKWKQKPNSEVERSLFERATGYSHPEVKLFLVDSITVTADGDKIMKKEVLEHTVTKHYPPDPTSMIYWLNNRDKENWKHSQEVNHNHTGQIELKAAMDAAEANTGVIPLEDAKQITDASIIKDKDGD